MHTGSWEVAFSWQVPRERHAGTNRADDVSTCRFMRRFMRPQGKSKGHLAMHACDCRNFKTASGVGGTAATALCLPPDLPASIVCPVTFRSWALYAKTRHQSRLVPIATDNLSWSFTWTRSGNMYLPQPKGTGAQVPVFMSLLRRL